MLKNLKIILTQDCNLRCDYCVQKQYGYSRAAVKFSMIKRMVDHAFRYWIKEGEGLRVFFSGGEPLLQFGLLKRCVGYIQDNYRGRRIEYKITTNGTLLSRGKIDFLIRNRFLISLSMDGDRLSHDLGRRFISKQGSFIASVKHLPLLTGYDRFSVGMVVTPDNVGKLRSNVHFFIRNNVLVIKFMIDLYPYPAILSRKRWSERSFRQLKGQIRGIVKDYFILRKSGKQIGFPNLFSKYNQQDNCASCFRVALTLMPTGYVHVCSSCYFMSFKALFDRFIVGKVMDRGFSGKLKKLAGRLEEIDNQVIFENKTVKELSRDSYKICFFLESDGDTESLDYMKFQRKIFKFLHDSSADNYIKAVSKGVLV